MADIFLFVFKKKQKKNRLAGGCSYRGICGDSEE
jgi:hypothetical protein